MSHFPGSCSLSHLSIPFILWSWTLINRVNTWSKLQILRILYFSSSLLFSSSWLYGSLGSDCAWLVKTSAAELCLVSQEDYYMTLAHSVRGSHSKFFASAVQAEHKGEIFLASLKENLLEKYEFSHDEDFFL